MCRIQAAAVAQGENAGYQSVEWYLPEPSLLSSPYSHIPVLRDLTQVPGTNALLTLNLLLRSTRVLPGFMALPGSHDTFQPL